MPCKATHIINGNTNYFNLIKKKNAKNTRNSAYKFFYFSNEMSLFVKNGMADSKSGP